MPRLDYQPTPKEATPYIKEEAQSPTSTYGSLVITEEERVGNPFKELIASNYDLFAPFDPYGYVVIGNKTEVGNGRISIAKDALEGENRDIDLKMLLTESVLRNALDKGTNYTALQDWATFLSYATNFVFTEHSYTASQNEREIAVQLLNPYQDGRSITEPFELFSAVTTSLMLNGEGIKDYLLDQPKGTTTYYTGSNYQTTETVETDNPMVDVAKELIGRTMDYFDHQVEKGAPTPSDLTALFPKDGVIRYELFHLS